MVISNANDNGLISSKNFVKLTKKVTMAGLDLVSTDMIKEESMAAKLF